MNKKPQKRVLILLFAGDYYDAYYRMTNNLGEAYHHHNYALNAISQLSTLEDVDSVAVLGCATEEAYDRQLDIGFRVIGAALDPYKNPQKINQIISDYQPTHLILRFPTSSILRWGIRNRVKVITLLADSFKKNTLKDKFKSFRIARLLNHPQVEWVGNHHLNSCLSLKNIGVNGNKIVPWDWPRERDTPLDFEPKKLPQGRSSFTFAYVGSVSEAKGVGDLVEALALLKKQGILATLKIAGGGNIDAFKQKAQSLQVENSIEFLGRIPNEKVVQLMRDVDIVFVPSRHSYAEGLPSTIYEAFCSRTPLVASDHPMFLRNVEDGYSALIFPEKDPVAIAKRVEQLLRDPELYFRLSSNSFDAWKRLQISVTWANLVHRWVADTPQDQLWIKNRTLCSGFYDHRLG